MSRFNVKKVAVLGAGVMGAQIAAHLVNVKVPVVLFDPVLPNELVVVAAVHKPSIVDVKIEFPATAIRAWVGVSVVP